MSILTPDLDKGNAVFRVVRACLVVGWGLVVCVCSNRLSMFSGTGLFSSRMLSSSLCLSSNMFLFSSPGLFSSLLLS